VANKAKAGNRIRSLVSSKNKSQDRVASSKATRSPDSSSKNSRYDKVGSRTSLRGCGFFYSATVFRFLLHPTCSRGKDSI
jgi:hypothetical protein